MHHAQNWQVNVVTDSIENMMVMVMVPCGVLHTSVTKSIYHGHAKQTTLLPVGPPDLPLSHATLQNRAKRSVCTCCNGSGEEECAWCHGTGDAQHTADSSGITSGSHCLS
jgi:hypothetical protein